MAAPKTPVWKFAGVNSYLMGSVHVLPKEGYDLPSAFPRAYALAKRIVFEAKPSQSTSALIVPGGKDLDSSVSQRVATSVARACSRLEIRYEDICRLRPWAVALNLLFATYARNGISQKFGVEARLSERASADQKRLGYLESQESVFEILNSVPNEAQERFLDGIANRPEYEIMIEILDCIKGWHNWDIPTLLRAQGRMIARCPEAFDLLLVGRNQEWVAKIAEFLSDGEPTLFVVGALHLVGDRNLMSLLEQQGKKLEILP